MRELTDVEVLETVMFESIENYIFCIRYQIINGTVFCDVYAATSEPVEQNGMVEERFNLVDVDGSVVEDFSDACRIVSITDTHSFDNELFFTLGFNGDYWMNYSELEALHEIIEEDIKPQLTQFNKDLNGQL